MNKLIFVSLMYLFFILVLHYGIKVQSLDISIPREDFENNTAETDLDFNELNPDDNFFSPAVSNPIGITRQAQMLSHNEITTKNDKTATKSSHHAHSPFLEAS